MELFLNSSLNLIIERVSNSCFAIGFMFLKLKKTLNSSLEEFLSMWCLCIILESPNNQSQEHILSRKKMIHITAIWKNREHLIQFNLVSFAQKADPIFLSCSFSLEAVLLLTFLKKPLVYFCFYGLFQKKRAAFLFLSRSNELEEEVKKERGRGKDGKEERVRGKERQREKREREGKRKK